MSDTEIIYSYDIVQLTVSGERHRLFESYDILTLSPAYMELSQLKERLSEQADQFGLLPKIEKKITSLADEVIATANGIYQIFATLPNENGGKRDHIITIRRVEIENRESAMIYSYQLAALLLPSVKVRKNEILFDIPLIYRGTVHTEFEPMKAELENVCMGKNEINHFVDLPALKDSVSDMELDITNIGAWEKKYEEKKADNINGDAIWKLNVFRRPIMKKRK